MTRCRRAGSRWRILVHDMAANGMNGISRHVKSNPREGLLPSSPIREDSEWSKTTILPGTEFDELVVGRWCHIEQMDVGFWWMSIGGVVLHVKADRDGRPKKVTVHTAGTWDDPVPGCEYEVDEDPVELHEWSCPSCGAVTRARLADQTTSEAP